MLFSAKDRLDDIPSNHYKRLESATCIRELSEKKQKTIEHRVHAGRLLIVPFDSLPCLDVIFLLLHQPEIVYIMSFYVYLCSIMPV